MANGPNRLLNVSQGTAVEADKPHLQRYSLPSLQAWTPVTASKHRERSQTVYPLAVFVTVCISRSDTSLCAFIEGFVRYRRFLEYACSRTDAMTPPRSLLLDSIAHMIPLEAQPAAPEISVVTSIVTSYIPFVPVSILTINHYS